MAKNTTKQKRLGIFYRSNGRWTTTPYAGITFTPYQANRNPLKRQITDLRNNVLKSRVRLRPVAA